MVETFDYLKVSKNIKYKDVKDEELVKEAQMDMDSYREKSFWQCPSCQKKVSYPKSLEISKEKYIHEIRASALNIECETSSSCKKKMSLKHDHDFYSQAFEELFSRYQGWIVQESEKAKSIDSPEEIYGELCSCFSKIVGMFARESKFSKTSEKWFSSFFYKSIQNKISDIQKTKNYQKRSPLIKCEICHEYVGKITSKHLCSDGHESFLKKAYIDLGKQIMYDSGEISHYSFNSFLMEKRAFFLGVFYLSKKDKKESQNILKNRLINLYFSLYPEAKIKNNILSTNVPIDDEDNSNTIEDTACASATSVFKNVVEDITSNESIENIIKIFYENNSKNKYIIDRMFKKEDFSEEKKVSILREIIHEKISYFDVKNSEIDRSYDFYIKDGFTTKLIKMIKFDNSCRIEMQKYQKKKLMEN